MARFVLVHGAWHGGWCFAALAEALRAHGHLVSAPDLPCDVVGLDQRDYAARIGPQPDAIVVGHSLGAQTVGHVEARRHVYLGGVLPVVDRMSEAFADGFGGFLRDEQGRSYWPDAETAATRLFADCDRERADRAFARLRPQAPFDAVRAPLGPGDVVVATMRDVAIDPAWQVRTARACGAGVIELDAGHFAFFTHPEELAAVLDSLA
jgi:predicted alpha/beta hydrolase family esterase